MRSSAAHSANARPSFQSIAGRSTRCPASSSTAPCICPDRPMARTAASACGARPRSCSIAWHRASHQSCGSCSLHCGCGREISSAASASATTRWLSSSNTSLTPEVPRSMPRNIRAALVFEPEAAVHMAPELTGCHALDVEEAPVEARDVVEADFVADLGDVAVRLHQQLAGAVDAHLVHEIGEGVAGGAPKETREAAFGHVQLGRQIGGGQWLGQVVGDAADDRVDLVEFG